MRKRYISLIVGAVLLIAVSVGATYALLVTSSNAVVNTFTVGGVDIKIGESIFLAANMGKVEIEGNAEFIVSKV